MLPSTSPSEHHTHMTLTASVTVCWIPSHGKRDVDRWHMALTWSPSVLWKDEKGLDGCTLKQYNSGCTAVVQWFTTLTTQHRITLQPRVTFTKRRALWFLLNLYGTPWPTAEHSSLHINRRPSLTAEHYDLQQNPVIYSRTLWLTALYGLQQNTVTYSIIWFTAEHCDLQQNTVTYCII